VNAAPHIGHVLEFVQTDAIARHQRLRGKDVALITGADENSLKNVQAAEKLGIGVKELCDRNSEAFEKIAKKVGLSYTCFRRTSDREKHWPGVQRLWGLCGKKGDIYKKKYSGLYCVGCEAFYEPGELEGGECPEHRSKPEEIEEENYFFRLSKYEKELGRLIESGELLILPEGRKNETLSFIRGGLKDFSISRSVARAKGWGVPVPGDESQIQYVWFDALSTYITGIGYGLDEREFSRCWPCDAHVIGKGILRFHAVYWPAMLLSAGLPLPKCIFVHGYITVEGQKMSKSLGNIVDPNGLIDKYGADPVRYCLLSSVPTFDDGDYSEKTLIEASNNELLANIGNLVNRTLVFASREFEGKVPDAAPDDEGKEFTEGQNARLAEVGALLDKGQLKDALHLAMHCGKEANAFFQKSEPWKSAKGDRGKCASAIYVLLHQVKDLAIALGPFIPHTSEAIFRQLAIEPRKWDDVGKLSLAAGHRLGKPEILFRKIEQGKPAGEGKGIALDLEIGRIIEVKRHPNAEKLYVEKVQLGDGERQIVSGLVPYLKEEELLGKLVVIVKNLKPASLRGVESRGMLLAVESGGKLEVLSPAGGKPGDKVLIEGADAKDGEAANAAGSAAALPEITIDQFAKVKFEVKAHEALAGGRRLLAGGKPVRTEKLAEGKVR
jgi:methionyl-tRNA synthetase